VEALLHIGDSVLLADRLHPRLKPLVGLRGQVGPEVVLDLVVEKPLEEIAYGMARVIVHRARDLP